MNARQPIETQDDGQEELILDMLDRFLTCLLYTSDAADE